MAMRHRNIVSVVDIRENEDSGPYIVMELLERKNLTELLPLRLNNCSGIQEVT